MGGLLAQDLKLINDLDNSDTEDDYTQFKPVLSRPEEAFIKAKKSELRTGTDYFESPANQEVYRSLMKLTPEQLKEQAVSTAKDVADVTPLIGEIKALSELPSNLAYASELVKLGYDENDLVTMGLGGAYSILAAMGVIPGVRLGAKVAKKAIKKNFGEIMDEELNESVKAKFTKSSTDASETFGEGAKRVEYKDQDSGANITVIDRTAQNKTSSIIDLNVPEEFRKRGIGKEAVRKVMEDYPNVMGQVSSKAAAKNAYDLGRRPPNNPNATLEEVFKSIDEDSSVNLVSPQALPKKDVLSSESTQDFLEKRGLMSKR